MHRAHVRAVGQQHLQRAFGGDLSDTVSTVGGNGIATLRLKRDLCNDLNLFTGSRRVQADFIGKGQQGNVDSIAVIIPLSPLIDQMPFVAKNACPYQRLDMRFRPFIERSAIFHQNFTLAVVSLACNLQGQAIGQHQSTHSLFVDGQGAGLVAADIGATTQSFNSGEFAHDCVAPGHAVRSDREGNGQRYRQPFWNGRDGQRHCQEKDFAIRDAAQNRNQCQHGAGAQHGKAHVARKALHANDQWRFGGFGSGDSCRDFTHSRMSAGGEDNAHPTTGYHRRTSENEIGTLCKRQIARKHAGMLLHGQRLTGQQRLIDRQVMRLQKPNVRRYAIRRGQTTQNFFLRKCVPFSDIHQEGPLRWFFNGF